MADGSNKCKLRSLVCQTWDCGTTTSSEEPSLPPPSPPLALYLMYGCDSSYKHWQELSLKLYVFASTLPCRAMMCHDWLRSPLPPSLRRRRFHLSVMRRNISVRTEQREWESGSVTPPGTASAEAWRRVPLLCETVSLVKTACKTKGSQQHSCCLDWETLQAFTAASLPPRIQPATLEASHRFVLSILFFNIWNKCSPGSTVCSF